MKNINFNLANKIFFLIIFSIITFLPYITCAITPEEILNKVQKQRELLQDLQANIITKTTRANKTTETTAKYYYKYPDKTRTEGILPSQEIVIRDGMKIMIKKSTTSEVKTIEPPKTSSTNTTTYNTSDIYNVKVVEEGKNIYRLEMDPKKPERFITKMEMVIDYDKGVIIKTVRYDNAGKVMMESENKDYKLFNDKVWLPMKTINTTKFPQNPIEPIIEQNRPMPEEMYREEQIIRIPEPKFPEFEITTETEFTDVKVNTGLNEDVFKF